MFRPASQPHSARFINNRSQYNPWHTVTLVHIMYGTAGGIHWHGLKYTACWGYRWPGCTCLGRLVKDSRELNGNNRSRHKGSRKLAFQLTAAQRKYRKPYEVGHVSVCLDKADDGAQQMLLSCSCSFVCYANGNLLSRTGLEAKTAARSLTLW